jgi:hypothetical protein
LSFSPAVSVMIAAFVTVAEGRAPATLVENATSTASASTADAQGKSRLTFTDSSPFLRFPR